MEWKCSTLPKEIIEPHSFSEACNKPAIDENSHIIREMNRSEFRNPVALWKVYVQPESLKQLLLSIDWYSLLTHFVVRST